jgi:hypothetical protein
MAIDDGGEWVEHEDEGRSWTMIDFPPSLTRAESSGYRSWTLTRRKNCVEKESRDGNLQQVCYLIVILDEMS